jgi:dipeptidyl aminopeptidase/acylaminoacyl peptidase
MIASAVRVAAALVVALFAQFQQRPPDFERQLQQQAETDKIWRTASDGFMQMDKITYRSKAGDMDIPAFVFQPLKLRGAKGHPAIVWVHENIRGHLYEHYIPYIREATAKGYIVIAPEYRGSIGYGPALYDAIDYGGAEVDDVLTAVDYLKANVPQVDPARIGIAGWSHGGMITVLAVTRNPALFKAAVAMVPVTNLFHRLARKGVERQRRAIDPQNRFGGSPSERRTAAVVWVGVTVNPTSVVRQVTARPCPARTRSARPDDVRVLVPDLARHPAGTVGQGADRAGVESQQHPAAPDR